MVEQMKTFADEMMLFFDMTEVEQKFQLENQIPTVDQYIERRMGSGAVGVLLAITEYSLALP